MKKFIYSVIIAVFVSCTITSCTEEEVKPTALDSGAAPAGGGSTDKLK